MHRRLALHLAAWLAGAALLRVGMIPPEICPAAAPFEVRVAVERAVGWLTGNQHPDGRFTYGFDRDAGEVNADSNAARHAGVMMSLYQVAGSVDPGALAAADAGLRLVLGQTIDGDGWTAWAPPGGDVPLGANSLLAAGLAIRRDVTGDRSYDDLMRRLGGFLLGQQLPDGNMLAYWRPSTGEPVPGVTGKWAIGEAAWALAMLDTRFPGEGWGEAAVLTLDYMNLRRDRDEGRISRLPDHWAAYTLEALRPDLLTDERAGYARQLAGYFGIRLRFESQRTGEGLNLLTRWYPGPPAGVGTAGEGLGALWRLSLRDDRLADLQQNMEERLRCTAGFMTERQAVPTGDDPRPELVEGAWFYRGYTQMDDQQHVISALLAALEAGGGR